MIKPADIPTDLHYPVVTMGTFDGVHLGHQKLLRKVISRAQKMNGESVVITYFHHPKETLTTSLSSYLLTERERKTDLLKQIGIDQIFYLQFDKEMARMKAGEFLTEILIKRVGAREIVFGYDCHFGNGREGDYHFLKKKEKTYGYRSFLIKPVKIAGDIVSSSLIRNLIRSGQVSEAKSYLGRYYDLEAILIKGLGIGKKIGYPTLNLKPTDPYKLLPANGVYLGKAFTAGQEFFCLTNIGYCPTLKQLDERSVESFLLDFTGEIREKRINVNFITRLRDEIKFPDTDSLSKAIQQDIKVAGELINQIIKGKNLK